MALSHAYPTTRTREIGVLVVDAADEIRSLLDGAVRDDRYRVHTASDGEAALTQLHRVDPDVIVLGLALPDIDGLEVCRRIRAISDVYIIIVTPQADDLDKVVGLAVGADDYVTMPCSGVELVARIGAMLRRPRRVVASSSSAGRRFGRLLVDPIGREVTIDGHDAGVTRIEFELLAALTERPGMVFSRAMLIEAVWGPNWVGDDHLVDVHIANLRKKIDRHGVRHIKTVRGVGYRMAVDPTL